MVIVDDHAAFRSAAGALLEAEGYRVVGEAENGATALDAVRALRPDVVLLDVQLPDMNGFDVAERFAEEGMTVAVVFISTHGVSAFRWRLTSNPTWRFILKSELSGEALAAAIE